MDLKHVVFVSALLRADKAARQPRRALFLGTPGIGCGAFQMDAKQVQP